MVLFDSISRQALYVTEAKNETNALYVQAIGRLKAKGIEIPLHVQRVPKRVSV